MIDLDLFLNTVQSHVNHYGDEASRIYLPDIVGQLPMALVSFAKKVSGLRNMRDRLKKTFTVLISGTDPITGAYVASLTSAIDPLGQGVKGGDSLIVNPPFDNVQVGTSCTALYSPLPICNEDCERDPTRTYYTVHNDQILIATDQTLLVNDPVYISGSYTPHLNIATKQINISPDLEELLLKEIVGKISLLRGANARITG